MRGALKIPLLLGLCLGLAACATMSGPTASAPQPLKPIDVGQFFTGRWYEIARTPISLVKGCVAGTTDFYHNANGRLVERDECRMGSPEGKVKNFQGPIHILNPGQNNKFVVHYTLFYVVPFAQTYWILDHGTNYHWFIVATPSFKEISILDRDPRPTAAQTAALVARARALGYDVSKLQFPPEFPPGQG